MRSTVKVGYFPKITQQVEEALENTRSARIEMVLLGYVWVSLSKNLVITDVG